MDHRDTGTQLKASGFSSWNLPQLCLRASVVALVFVPVLAEACPRCIEASPNKTGLFWAAMLLLPVPFALAGGLVWWIRHWTRGQFPHY